LEDNKKIFKGISLYIDEYSFYATFSEGYTGEIKKGNLADFVILEKSLFSDNIGNSVLATILGGKVIWMT